MTDRQASANGVRAAAARLKGVVTETPLLPLDWEGRRLWVKAECLQQGGSFKLRGATNRLLLLSDAERAQASSLSPRATTPRASPARRARSASPRPSSCRATRRR